MDNDALEAIVQGFSKDKCVVKKLVVAGSTIYCARS